MYYLAISPEGEITPKKAIDRTLDEVLVSLPEGYHDLHIDSYLAGKRDDICLDVNKAIRRIYEHVYYRETDIKDVPQAIISRSQERRLLNISDLKTGAILASAWKDARKDAAAKLREIESEREREAKEEAAIKEFVSKNPPLIVVSSYHFAADAGGEYYVYDNLSEREGLSGLLPPHLSGRFISIEDAGQMAIAHHWDDASFNVEIPPSEVIIVKVFSGKWEVSFFPDGRWEIQGVS